MTAEPIIAKRRAIITGEQEAPENLTEEGKKAVAEDESATRGIPEFWLTALRNHPELDDRVSDHSFISLRMLLLRRPFRIAVE